MNPIFLFILNLVGNTVTRNKPHEVRANLLSWLPAGRAARTAWVILLAIIASGAVFLSIQDLGGIALAQVPGSEIKGNRNTLFQSDVQRLEGDDNTIVGNGPRNLRGNGNTILGPVQLGGGTAIGANSCASGDSAAIGFSSGSGRCGTR